jgi:xanthine dehydrogenase YagS FAD-binding subunit
VLRSDEVLTGIRVPAPAAGTRSGYAKIRHKQSFDWALVELAVSLQLQGSGPTPTIRAARVVLGAVAPIPWRATEAEKALQGRPATEATFARAAKLAVKGAKPLAENAYKVTQAEVLLRRTLDRVAKAKG